MTQDVKSEGQGHDDVKKSAMLCADQGWRSHIYLKSGEVIEGAFITAADWDKDAIVIERMGERHIKPRLLFLTDISKLEADWSGK